jgi:hypothetical protein
MKPLKLISGSKPLMLAAICAVSITPWLAGGISTVFAQRSLAGHSSSDQDDDNDDDGHKTLVLRIDVANRVGYNYDTADPTLFATNPGPTPATPSKNFIPVVVISDIIAVNGEPAKGVKVDLATLINLRTMPNPALGQAIADVPLRAVITRSVWEILRPDGTPVGTLMTEGFGGGPPPPGAPADQVDSNEAIVGGTGAYLGARGQVGQIAQIPGRTASVTENPANRRVNGGGSRSYVLQILRK